MNTESEIKEQLAKLASAYIANIKHIPENEKQVSKSFLEELWEEALEDWDFLCYTAFAQAARNLKAQNVISQFYLPSDEEE
jgi:hypothetical protein